MDKPEEKMEGRKMSFFDLIKGIAGIAVKSVVAFFGFLAIVLVLFLATGSDSQSLTQWTHGINPISANAYVVDGTLYTHFDKFTQDGIESFFYDLDLAIMSGARAVDIRMINPGGRVSFMWAMYDRLKEAHKLYGFRLVTHCDGQVGSAAVPIYLLGDFRTIGENGFILIHPHSNSNASLFRDIPPTVQAMYDRWTRRYAEILVENTGLSAGEVVVMLTGDSSSNVTMLSSEESVKLGIANAIEK